HISIVAQSGGVAEVINQRFSELGVGVRMYASNGNACDISIPDIIEYWEKDEKTRVIVLYIEGISDPKKFMEVIKKSFSQEAGCSKYNYHFNPLANPLRSNVID
ncbi:MAG: hypothetical protein GY757_22415, partial [bacterium]|nr:hypothetical protein [bacterium]